MKIIRFNNKEELNIALFNDLYITCTNVLNNKPYMNLGIATGNTYSYFFNNLYLYKNIPLEKINLFMIDEYAALDPYDEKSCAYDIIHQLTNLDRFFHFYTFTKDSYINQIRTYNQMLEEHPFDLLLLGIGNNGHYGFCQNNDEGKTNFTYKITHFSEAERQQQVDLGWFSNIAEVPSEGITITEYGVLKSDRVIFSAYYDQKKEIINQILQNQLSSHCAIYPLLQKTESLLFIG